MQARTIVGSDNLWTEPKATWALVIGGAGSVFQDIRAVEQLLGKPPVVVAVKDIGIAYPQVDHWCTYHADRIPKELPQRQYLMWPMPKCIWTNYGARISFECPTEIKRIKLQGGSSGLLGAVVGLVVAEKAVLAGIPMDPSMRHFNDRKKGKPWDDGRLYWKHWQECLPILKDRVRSISGRTRELLGKPTLEWKDG